MADKNRRVALVVGAGGGIGAAVTKILARDGYAVYPTFRQQKSKVEKIVSDIIKNGGGGEAVYLDVTDNDLAENVCKNIYENEKRLDILVNCAGVNIESPALALDDDSWNKVLNTNLSGIFRLCKAAARFMLIQRWGRIINFSSIAASYGGRGQINYAAGKAGVEAMTRVLAIELGRKGILVNCVAPGVIITPMSQRVRDEYGDKILSEIAVRRFGAPEEVAEMVAFLVSEKSSYITGQVIKINGGLGL